jgi:uncharacterized protein
VKYYLDTSALLKQYVHETGSIWLQGVLAAPGTFATTTHLVMAEVISALNRRVREGNVTAADYARLADRFRDDCRVTYQLIAVNNAILQSAGDLLERHPLRAYDAIHLATALTINRRLLASGALGVVFLSADDRLLQGAITEGLAVDNPNEHP